MTIKIYKICSKELIKCEKRSLYTHTTGKLKAQILKTIIMQDNEKTHNPYTRTYNLCNKAKPMAPMIKVYSNSQFHNIQESATYVLPYSSLLCLCVFNPTRGLTLLVSVLLASKRPSVNLMQRTIQPKD